MKVLERVLEKRIRCQVSIDNMLFGFMPLMPFSSCDTYKGKEEAVLCFCGSREGI